MVFAGLLGDEERSALLANRNTDLLFIPSQVGLPDLQEVWDTPLYDDDHVWHELEADSIRPTDAPPTELGDVHQFAAAFAAADWDVAAAEARVGIVRD